MCFFESFRKLENANNQFMRFFNVFIRLNRFSNHRGLQKNFAYFLQSNQELIAAEDPEILQEFTHLLK